MGHNGVPHIPTNREFDLTLNSKPNLIGLIVTVFLLLFPTWDWSSCYSHTHATNYWLNYSLELVLHGLVKFFTLMWKKNQTQHKQQKNGKH